jgi:hypothetical protein
VLPYLCTGKIQIVFSLAGNKTPIIIKSKLEPAMVYGMYVKGIFVRYAISYSGIPADTVVPSWSRPSVREARTHVMNEPAGSQVLVTNTAT